MVIFASDGLLAKHVNAPPTGCPEGGGGGDKDCVRACLGGSVVVWNSLIYNIEVELMDKEWRAPLFQILNTIAYKMYSFVHTTDGLGGGSDYSGR